MPCRETTFAVTHVAYAEAIKSTSQGVPSVPSIRGGDGTGRFTRVAGTEWDGDGTAGR